MQQIGSILYRNAAWETWWQRRLILSESWRHLSFVVIHTCHPPSSSWSLSQRGMLVQLFVLDFSSSWSSHWLVYTWSGISPRDVPSSAAAPGRWCAPAAPHADRYHVAMHSAVGFVRIAHDPSRSTPHASPTPFSSVSNNFAGNDRGRTRDASNHDRINHSVYTYQHNKGKNTDNTRQHVVGEGRQERIRSSECIITCERMGKQWLSSMGGMLLVDG